MLIHMTLKPLLIKLLFKVYVYQKYIALYTRPFHNHVPAHTINQHIAYLGHQINTTEVPDICVPYWSNFFCHVQVTLVPKSVIHHRPFFLKNLITDIRYNTTSYDMKYTFYDSSDNIVDLTVSFLWPQLCALNTQYDLITNIAEIGLGSNLIAEGVGIVARSLLYLF